MVTSKEIGNFGEEIALRYLVSMGYVIISRNTFGRGFEIDIIAKMGEVHSFFEIKCVAREKMGIRDFSREMSVLQSRIDHNKYRNLVRGVESLTRQYKIKKFDLRLICVGISLKDKRSFVRVLDL